MSGLRIFKNYPGLSTLLAFEVFLFLVVSYQVQVDNRLSLLEKMGLIVFGPIQELNHRAVGSVNRVFESRKDRQTLLQENQRLQAMAEGNAQLKSRLTELELQNERLRELLALPVESGWRQVHAEVIGSTQHRGDHMITINKGANQGIRRDLGVYGVDGVVGVVWEVTGGYAKVMTINNPSAVLASLIQSSRYQESFVAGMGGSKARLANFPNFETIRPMDLVLTSGLDGIFPKGLHIGRVLSGKPSDHMFQEVEIELATDFARLEEVIVLLPEPREGSP